MWSFLHPILNLHGRTAGVWTLHLSFSLPLFPFPFLLSILISSRNFFLSPLLSLYFFAFISLYISCFSFPSYAPPLFPLHVSVSPVSLFLPPSPLFPFPTSVSPISLFLLSLPWFSFLHPSLILIPASVSLLFSLLLPSFSFASSVFLYFPFPP